MEFILKYKIIPAQPNSPTNIICKHKDCPTSSLSSSTETKLDQWYMTCTIENLNIPKICSKISKTKYNVREDDLKSPNEFCKKNKKHSYKQANF